jgi:hypothetical protein
MRRPAVCALACSLAAFLVYLRTLQPDLGGPEDTPKFQYLGFVLGTAHEPGYPLQIILEHLFSYLPFGTVAYRANLMSAVLAALAIGMAARTAMALSAARGAAAFGALTIAFGAPFWRYADLAEVYALSSLLFAGIIYWMIRWGQTGRPAHVYLASLFFALEIANHLSIAAATPGIAAFLLVSPSRRRLTVRTVVAAGLIAVSGFLFYGYIWIRTVQNVPYLEVRADSIAGLVQIIRAHNYSDLVFKFTWDQIWSHQLPALWRVEWEQMGTIGIIFAAIGLFALWKRDWRSAVFLTLSAGGMIAFVLDLFGDLPGFLVTPMIAFAVLMAVGIDLPIRLLRRVPFRPGGALASVAAVGLVVLPLQANFHANDWTENTQDATYFKAFAEQMPARFGLLSENYVVDCMVSYAMAVLTLGQKSLVRPEADVQAVGDMLDRGLPVYSFDAGEAALAPLGFDFQPVDLLGPTLASRLAGARPGAHVALASTGRGIPPDVLEALGLSKFVPAAWTGRPYQVLLAPAGGAPDFIAASADVERSMDLPRPRDTGETASLVAHAGPDAAWITLGESSIGVTTDGVIAAVIDPSGRVTGAYIANAPQYRIQMPRTALKLYRIAGRLPTEQFGGGDWHDITTVTGDGLFCLFLDNDRPFEAGAVVYAANDTPLRPSRDVSYLGGTGEPETEVSTFDRENPADRDRLAALLADDGLDARQLGAYRYVGRLTLRVNDEGKYSASMIGFGSIPARVLAHATTDEAAARRAVAFAMRSRRLLARSSLEDVGVSNYFEWLIGPGWDASHRDDDGAYRWAVERDARFLLPMAVTDGVTISLRVAPADNARPGTVRLSANGRDLGACALRPDWQTCRWPVPDGVLRIGGNTFSMESSVLAPPSPDHDTYRGAVVRWIRVRR